jgi:hypothetical protein
LISVTRAEQILAFCRDVHFDDALPESIGILNPYRASSDIRDICHLFYHKYYDDDKPRRLILGINPGRLGSGSTGIPFTDTKRLNSHCDIAYEKFVTHEPSSAFVYLMIEAYGGVEKFYKDFYINSICPLGFIKGEGSKVVNYNYYDDKALTLAATPFIKWNIPQQIKIAGRSDICFVFGTGKNYGFLQKLNQEIGFFDKIIPLEHPRYIMQYKAKMIDQYIENYLLAFEDNQ